MFHNYKLNMSILIGILIGLILGGFVYPANTMAQESRVGVVYYCVDTLGVNGATNLSDTLVDDGRFGSVELVDGALEEPTTQELLNRFDCVISMTGDALTCGNPGQVYENAGNVIGGYAEAGRGLVISTFGFATGIGFGPALFEPGLSPFQRVQAGNGLAGPVNIAGAAESPSACARMLSGVGAFSSTFSNFVDLSNGAALCASYDNGELFLAINEARNVIGLNTFPTSQNDLAQPSYQLLVSNTVFEACSLRLNATIPTLSEWGLLTLAIVLGALGLFAVRRRNMAAQG